MGTNQAGSTLPRGQRAEHVRKHLEAAIVAGEFGPGQQLPSERQLVEAFGVSRLSVREGIQGLIGKGLVEARHGAGYFVVAGVGEGYRDAFAAWLAVHSHDLIALLEVRGALWILAAQRALRPVPGVSLQQILDAHEAFVKAVEADAGAREVADLDVNFHNAIADAGGSPLISALLRELGDRLTEPRHDIMALPGQPQRSAREHLKIVDAFKASDPAAVAQAIDDHVQSTCRTISAQAGGPS
jgi:DNA-binding FadR family transcriptional regulator